MSISVIVPLYNKEKNIYDTINSVLEQTYKDFEIIVIDDGSTDNSSEIVKKMQKKDNRIKYYYIENSGVANARNQGIIKANGEYISFLDADDRWHPEFLSKMFNSINNGNVCYAGSLKFDGKKYNKVRIDFNEGSILLPYLYNQTTPDTNSWLIKKELITNNSIVFPIDLNWGEDMTFFAKVLMHDNNVSTPAEYLTIYDINVQDSLTKQDDNKIEKDILWLESLYQYFRINLNNKKLLIDCKSAIFGYRIPALIIYRIHSISKVDVAKASYLFEKYYTYIKKLKFNNGPRSIKAYIHYLKLRSRLK